jgi:hypothetical protein
MTYAGPSIPWADGSGGGTPITAAELTRMEGNAEQALGQRAVYPLLEGYGFHSTSVDPAAAAGDSTFASWMVRVWVPAGKVITTIGQPVALAGTVTGATDLDAWAVYSDNGSSLLGQTANVPSFWTTVGMRTASLLAPVAAQGAGRFVRVLANLSTFSAAPHVAYFIAGGSSPTYSINGNPATLQRRTAATSSYAGSWPSSISPASLGTALQYLPLVFLG